jgi:hypothetical protein
MRGQENRHGHLAAVQIALEPAGHRRHLPAVTIDVLDA